MLPILERELIDKRHWMTSDEMLDYYAIGQSTPGIIAVNVATFIGYKQCGNVGGVCATLGVITPSLVIITLIAKFIGTIDEIAWVRKAFRGINVAVAANLTYATVNFARRTVKNLFGAILLLMAFAVIFFFNISSIIVIFAAAAAGIIEAVLGGQFRPGKKSGGGQPEGKNR